MEKKIRNRNLISRTISQKSMKDREIYLGFHRDSIIFYQFSNLFAFYLKVQHRNQTILVKMQRIRKIKALKQKHRRNLNFEKPISTPVHRRSLSFYLSKFCLNQKKKLPSGYQKFDGSKQLRKLFLTERSNFVCEKVHVVLRTFNSII